ncbi:MAG: hypothetical protein MJ074_07760 [Oscillospiraceae bacterium]|nr:hypothetical protein [Oscillospiraceae bacterium]
MEMTLMRSDTAESYLGRGVEFTVTTKGMAYNGDAEKPDFVAVSAENQRVAGTSTVSFRYWAASGGKTFENPMQVGRFTLTVQDPSKASVMLTTRLVYLAEETPYIPVEIPAVPPVDPTEPPVDPTEPPVDPTEPPVDPTEPPVDPTEPPVDPTEPPVEPTESPVDPTEPPVDPADPSPSPSPSPDPSPSPSPSPSPRPTSGGNSGAPSTGDESDPALWTAVMLLSAFVMAGSVFVMVKKEKEE